VADSHNNNLAVQGIATTPAGPNGTQVKVICGQRCQIWSKDAIILKPTLINAAAAAAVLKCTGLALLATSPATFAGQTLDAGTGSN
jgi:hypothetical protein